MLEVDVDSAIERRMEYFTNAIKRTLREGGSAGSSASPMTA